MPCAVIFQNSRTPFYDIIIESDDPDDLGVLRGYAALLCPESIKYTWNEEEYLQNGEEWITEYSVVTSDMSRLKYYSTRSIAICVDVYTVHDHIQRLGTIEFGIKYFSKYAFSDHRKLRRLTLLEKEELLNHIEFMSPQQLLLHYIKTINLRKIAGETEEMFYLC